MDEYELLQFLESDETETLSTISETFLLHWEFHWQSSSQVNLFSNDIKKPSTILSENLA